MAWLSIAVVLLFAGRAVAAEGRPQAAPGYPVAVGVSFRDRDDTPELVVIPAGQFTMGAGEAEATREGRRAETAAWERPKRPVAVSRPLAVGRHLVTVGEYASFVAATRRSHSGGCNVVDGGRWQVQANRSWSDPAFEQSARHPVTCVAVADAEAYAAWLSSITRHRYRLLHEAEWEYAARAGTATSRWWGDERRSLCRHANGADLSYDRARPGEPAVNRSCEDGFVFTSPVDAFPPNPFGLHDMLGNLWQWTADCFVPQSAGEPAEASDPVIGGDCSQRAIRGASWHNYPDALRSAARFALPVTTRSASIGFRIMRLPDEPTTARRR